MQEAMAHTHDCEIRKIAEMADEVVTAIRNRGHTREQAVTAAAERLGMRVSRVRDFIYGRVFSTNREERAAARARYLAFLDDEADQLMRRSEEVRARRRARETTG